jgi:hypothetical protein
LVGRNCIVSDFSLPLTLKSWYSPFYVCKQQVEFPNRHLLAYIFIRNIIIKFIKLSPVDISLSPGLPLWISLLCRRRSIKWWNFIHIFSRLLYTSFTSVWTWKIFMMDTKAEKKSCEEWGRANDVREIIAKYQFYQIAPRSH